jgi:hypothetical protein
MAVAIHQNPSRLTASQISLRGAMWGTALVAIGFGVLRIRAEIQCDFARTLQQMGCDVRYAPAMPWIDRSLADRTQTSFHMSHNLTFIKVYSEEDVDKVVAMVKQLPSVKEIELCIAGTCRFSWISAHRVADRVQQIVPAIQVKVSSRGIWIVG